MKFKHVTPPPPPPYLTLVLRNSVNILNIGITTDLKMNNAKIHLLVSKFVSYIEFGIPTDNYSSWVKFPYIALSK